MQACISHVKTSINNEASIVLSAALDLIGQSETRMNAENSRKDISFLYIPGLNSKVML